MTRKQIIAILRENLHKTQQRIKKYADLRRNERYFEVNEWVYIRLQSYRQQTVVHRRNMKLSPHFYGPFQILEKVGDVA